MAWLSVNKDRTENISPNEPIRDSYLNSTYCKETHKWKKEERKSTFWSDIEIIEMCYEVNLIIPLPDGTIEKLINKTLTWEDNPVEI